MAKKEIVKEITETEIIGDKTFDVNDVTAANYFDYVKEMKQTITDDYLNLVIDNGLKMLKKTKLTKQTYMAKMITHRIETALKELAVVRKGYNLFVARQDIDKYIHLVKDKSVKIIELKNYSREIPDEIANKLTDLTIKEKDADGNEVEKDMFDEYYVVFTDYTLKETKKVAKERREKDPVLFGAFLDTTNKNDIYMEDRLYFIADWVDENCDLTLREIVEKVKDKTGEDIVYKVDTPEDEDGIKKLLNSYANKPDKRNDNLTVYEAYLNDTPKKDSTLNKIKKAIKTVTKKSKKKGE